jgi:hypothetical protein
MEAREIEVTTVKMGRTNQQLEKQKARWWFEKDLNIAHAVHGVVNAIESRQRNRWLQIVTYASLYENVARVGLGPNPTMIGVRSSMGNVSIGQLGGRSSHNVVKSCVDTATAKIAKNKPRVKYITSEGSWSQQQRARKLTQYTDALFRVADAYEQSTEVFKDGAIFGLGALHVYPEGKDIKTERVIPGEVIVDEDDGAHGKPRQMHRRRVVAREVLMSMFPGKADLLVNTAAAPGESDSAADNVVVIESWHLPSRPANDVSDAEVHDGMHAISVENCTLQVEPWTKDYFPFVFSRWSKRVVGFWGLGLTEELSGIQLKINKLDRMIVAGIEMNCVPRCAVPHNSLTPGHQAYDAGVFYYKGGQPPVWSTAAGMPPEVYQERDKEIQYAYQMTGISQLSASSQKPAGLDSGAALREYQDQNTERFSIQGERYEGFFVELGRIMLDMSRDLLKQYKSLPLLAKSRRLVRKLDLADILLEESEFVRQAFPVSQLPNTPEGRLQFIQELAQAGYIDREVALELLNLGDTDDAMSLLTAAFDDAMMAIDSIMEEGEYVAPEPYMNLALTQKLAQSAYLRATCQGAPEDRCNMLRKFMNQIIALQSTGAANQNATPPEMAGGAPQAQPATPPTSDLLPNAPAAAPPVAA